MAIIVSPDTISNVANQVSSGAAELDSQRQRLLSQIQGLGDSWQGTAATQLQTLYAQWDKDVQALHNTLTQISAAMNKSAQEYAATEDSVANTFTQ